MDDRRELEDLLGRLCDLHPLARVVHVHYGAATAAEVSQRFFGGRPVPDKDCYGKAVYPYFFRLWAARNRYVLHADSNMMFGGGSRPWIAEARHALKHPLVFSCSPLPGPPEPGALVGEQSHVLVEQTTVVDPQRLGASAGRLDAGELRAVDDPLALILGI